VKLTGSPAALQWAINAAKQETEKRKQEAEDRAVEEAERALRPVGTLVDKTA
jgi:hypothetical protein